jgi:hypothetical protein
MYNDGQCSLRANCKTEHEKVAIFAHETMPCVLVVTGYSLKEVVIVDEHHKQQE